MKEVNSGILSGVKIDAEKAEVLAKVAEKENQLDNGVLDPEEIALGDIMGASSSVDDEVKLGASAEAGSGSQIAEHGLLTGVEISEDNAETLNKVAEQIEKVEAFESDGATGADAAGEISDTLAVTMGVK